MFIAPFEQKITQMPINRKIGIQFLIPSYSEIVYIIVNKLLQHTITVIYLNYIEGAKARSKNKYYKFL